MFSGSKCGSGKATTFNTEKCNESAEVGLLEQDKGNKPVSIEHFFTKKA